jgi:hypothetical protein
MKLYKRYNRLKYRKIISKKDEVYLRQGLAFKPGDVIATCTGFNGIIVEKTLNCRLSKKGWAIIDVDFDCISHKDAEFASSHSWFQCCQLAQTREEIEKWNLDWLEWLLDPNYDNIGNWYKDQEEQYRFRFETLKNGGHICDERGLILPEFIREPQFRSDKAIK